MTPNVRLTCKNCGKAGYLKDFTNCSQVDCKLQMAKNPRPPAILVETKLPPLRHHPECTCARCLEEDADNLEKAYDRFMTSVKEPIPVAAQVPAPVRQQIRVLYREVAVASSCEDSEGAVFVEVPKVIVGSIYPKGKRK